MHHGVQTLVLPLHYWEAGCSGGIRRHRPVEINAMIRVASATDTDPWRHEIREFTPNLLNRGIHCENRSQYALTGRLRVASTMVIRR
ncbi:hypothetical protein CEXT_224561 [Caerostris extrusa]|uniref:Uncharacterized protein n=1 Tax=Caerostris extrusa TaxID=172846 RepID=A0AAV4M4C8_CAEEX|nr:hypothetical protein CEXT_224561 [Caerostris extrusa]